MTTPSYPLTLWYPISPLSLYRIFCLSVLKLVFWVNPTHKKTTNNIVYLSLSLSLRSLFSLSGILYPPSLSVCLSLSLSLSVCLSLSLICGQSVCFSCSAAEGVTKGCILRVLLLTSPGWME